MHLNVWTQTPVPNAATAVQAKATKKKKSQNLQCVLPLKKKSLRLWKLFSGACVYWVVLTWSPVNWSAFFSGCLISPADPGPATVWGSTAPPAGQRCARGGFAFPAGLVSAQLSVLYFPTVWIGVNTKSPARNPLHKKWLLCRLFFFFLPLHFVNSFPTSSLCYCLG